MPDGRNGISFQITNRPRPELVSPASIVHPPLRNKLTIDISYQKCTGTIIGWYYHRNSAQYTQFIEIFTDFRNQKLLLKVPIFLRYPMLTL